MSAYLTAQDQAYVSFIQQLQNLGWRYNAVSDCWSHPAVKEKITARDIREMSQNGVFRAPIPKPDPTPFRYADVDKLRMRLDIPANTEFPWEDLRIVRGNQFVSVIITSNQGDMITVLQDDAPLFPSDTLIGKLRLLQP